MKDLNQTDRVSVDSASVKKAPLTARQIEEVENDFRRAVEPVAKIMRERWPDRHWCVQANVSPQGVVRWWLYVAEAMSSGTGVSLADALAVTDPKVLIQELDRRLAELAERRAQLREKP